MISFDTSAITAMINSDEVLQDVQEAAETLISDIFIDLTAPPPLGTPFDSGVARDGWQIDNSNPNAPEVYNMVPYIGALNNGHSQQSPAGFVDMIVDKHVR